MSEFDGLLLRSEGRLAVESGRAREIRLRARLSQEELGSAVGVSAACVCRWEAGERLPRGRTAERLAGLLRLLEKT